MANTAVTVMHLNAVLNAVELLCGRAHLRSASGETQALGEHDCVAYVQGDTRLANPTKLHGRP
jgi:hypothetical protein